MTVRWLLLALALTGCTERTRFTPFIQPTCVFLCITVVEQSTIDEPATEDYE